MELAIYALLGLIQGLTEFLPVSSSGHLVLAEHWLGLNPPGIVLEVAVHVATLISVLIVYRRDIARIISGPDWRYLGLLAIGTVVTVIVVLPVKEQLTVLTESPLAVRLTGAMLVLTAVWLALADHRLRRVSKERRMGYGSAALVGLAQAIGTLPGISRSGATIGAALQLGASRDEAARFSFLLSVPVILGAAIITAGDMSLAISEGALNWIGLVVAFIIAMISGIAAIHLVLRLLRRARLTYFAAYCVVLGAIALAVG